MATREPDLAERIVTAIKDDLTDRRGLRHSWEEIDDETKDEILDTWADLVREAVRRHG